MKRLWLLLACIVFGLIGTEANAEVQFIKKDYFCEEADFIPFAERYIENVDLQKKFTKTPLKESQIIDSTSKTPIFRNINKKKPLFPIIPSREARKKEGLKVRFELDKTIGRVVLYKEDTDYMIIYIFKKNSCWNLIAIQNWSL